jgi:hypothetical protein
MVTFNSLIWSLFFFKSTYSRNVNNLIRSRIFLFAWNSLGVSVENVSPKHWSQNVVRYFQRYSITKNTTFLRKSVEVGCGCYSHPHACTSLLDTYICFCIRRYIAFRIFLFVSFDAMLLVFLFVFPCIHSSFHQRGEGTNKVLLIVGEGESPTLVFTTLVGVLFSILTLNNCNIRGVIIHLFFW